MWKTILLILPVLVPSWRFFKTIEPSPRVQWALFSTRGDTAGHWHEFRPRPEDLSPVQMLKRLFWNPAWNESLFLVSCAERLQEQPTDHSINEIRRRVLREIARQSIKSAGKLLQFRLVFVHRDGATLSKEVVYLSDHFPVTCTDKDAGTNTDPGWDAH